MANAMITGRPLPSQEVLEQRLERQRGRVLSAHGICVLAARAASDAETNGELDPTTGVVALRSALEGLGELLESIKESISPEEIPFFVAESEEAAS